MEFIDLKIAEEELIKLGAEETIKELALNNLRLYNELVFDFDQGITKNLYLTYQLNVQVFKQFVDLKKATPKNPGEEDDEFKKLMQSLTPDKKGKK